MLTQIREKIVGPIGLAILAIIAVSFVFFGATLNFAGNIYAAKVEGSEISVGEFENAYRVQLDNNPTLASMPAEFRGSVRLNVLENLIRERLVELHLAEAGYQVSEIQLTESIQRIPDFQVDGQFDLEAAESLLAQNGLTSAQFRNTQRARLRIDQLRRAIGGTALVTPSQYRRYLNLVAEQRLVSLARFDLQAAAAEVEVSEAQIVAFYEENDTMFLLPETASIEYIELNRADVAAQVEISEEALNEYYLDSQNRYLQDEQRRARHILVLSGDDELAAEEKAKGLVARVEAGEPFEDLAATYSEDGTTSSQGGDLGARTRTQLSDELGSAVFTMGVGEVSGPIKSDFGFHIVRLDEILEQGPLPLEQVRGELLSELREQETDGMFRDLTRAASDALFDHDDMQSIAATIDVELQSAEGVQRSNAGPFGNNQVAIDAIFDEGVLLDGEISEVIEIDANRSAIFKVVEHAPASREALENVHDQVSIAVRSIEAESIVQDRAAQLLEALNNGEDFGIAAESAGAIVAPTTLVGRQDPEIDPFVLGEIFSSAKPAQDAPVRGQVGDQTGGQTVFSLEAVIPGRPQSIPLADRDAGKEQLAMQAGGADFRAFVEALYNDADIVINDDAVAASELLQ
ncbi:MAG: SurA N-terminal domain-containing protein [Woeseiaceae bacterium]